MNEMRTSHRFEFYSIDPGRGSGTMFTWDCSCGKRARFYATLAEAQAAASDHANPRREEPSP